MAQPTFRKGMRVIYRGWLGVIDSQPKAKHNKRRLVWVRFTSDLFSSGPALQMVNVADLRGV